MEIGRQGLNTQNSIAGYFKEKELHQTEMQAIKTQVESDSWGNS